MIWIGVNIPRVALHTEYDTYWVTVDGMEFKGETCVVSAGKTHQGTDGLFTLPSRWLEGVEVGDTISVVTKDGITGRKVLSVEVIRHA